MKQKQLFLFVGIFVLLFGLASGIVLLQQSTVFRLRANPETQPKDVTVSNITDSQATVTWITDGPSRGFVQWGEKDKNLSKVKVSTDINSQKVHIAELSGILPDSLYDFQISVDGKLYPTDGTYYSFASSNTLVSKPQSPQYISGKVVSENGEPIVGSIVLVTASGSSPISTTTSQSGDWTINISEARTQSLSSYIAVDTTTAIDITVQSPNFETKMQRVKRTDAQELLITLSEVTQ
jgi:hypothetical protein